MVTSRQCEWIELRGAIRPNRKVTVLSYLIHS
jgi:hypothetical protein